MSEATPVGDEPRPLNAINIPEPSLGRCIDGTSEYGFIACTVDADGHVVPLSPHPDINPVVVSQSAPAMDNLPETGASGVLLVVASILVALGVALKRVQR